MAVPQHEVVQDPADLLAVEQQLHLMLALVPRNDTWPGAGGLSASALKGLSRFTFTIGLHCIFRWNMYALALGLGCVSQDPKGKMKFEPMPDIPVIAGDGITYGVACL